MSPISPLGGEGPVLLSWLAQARDPTYNHKGSTRNGPTWVLLCDPASPWRGRVRDVVLFHSERDEPKARDTAAHSRGTDAALRFHLRAWNGTDPTDHQAIFAFLEDEMAWVRRQFPGRELVVHLSPGTPAMHAVWLLMVESGFIEGPVTAVQTVPEEFRGDGPAAIGATIGIDTFYKRYQATQPAQVSGPVDRFKWSIERFRSPAMVGVRNAARRYARLKAPVLILGERGTGKTHLAGWIRFHSPFRRADRDESWPTVACGQYTPELMRAELFGYKKGAFTGALTSRQGLLASADGDSLFLDEIGDISKDVQRLVIRAIEERSYLPLGDDKLRKSDFRLITATNLPVDELRKRLDPDFLDRISYLVVRLPPLRELRDDLDWLWDEVLRAAASSALVAPSLATSSETARTRFVEAARAHPLPGNLRDLFRSAYAWLAERAVGRGAEGEARATEAAIAALSDPLGVTSALAAAVEHPPEPDGMPRQVALAFALGSDLGGLLPVGESLSTGAIETELRAWLADELRQLARVRHVPVDALCDKSERTLRTWASRKGGDG